MARRAKRRKDQPMGKLARIAQRERVEREAPAGPTPEQARKYAYSEKRGVSAGQVANDVHSRLTGVPERLLAKDKISRPEYAAIEWLREQAAMATHSESKCTLDRSVSGGGDPHNWMLRVSEARANVRYAFAAIPPDYSRLFGLLAIEGMKLSSAARACYGTPPEHPLPERLRRKAETVFRDCAARLNIQVQHIVEATQRGKRNKG
ncbi:hypothetical protein ACSMXM_05550 [Pacificimonas sp. ICDLI1SI03]